MREVQKKNYCYSNDEYLSVFVGVCKSQELLDQYLEQDYELLNEYDCIGSEFGIDFGINFYMISVLYQQKNHMQNVLHMV